MAYSQRVQTYETGVLTANEVGSLSYFTVRSIVGRIFKVAAFTSASGTLTITESGTNEQIFAKAIASGTNYFTYYPQTTTTDTAGVALTSASGNIWEKPMVSYPLQIQHVAGSNLSFSNVKVYYQ